MVLTVLCYIRHVPKNPFHKQQNGPENTAGMYNTTTIQQKKNASVFFPNIFCMLNASYYKIMDWENDSTYLVNLD